MPFRRLVKAHGSETQMDSNMLTFWPQEWSAVARDTGHVQVYFGISGGFSE